MGDQKDHKVVRDVFGDSDEDEPAAYGTQNEIDQDSHVKTSYMRSSYIF